MAVNIFNSRTRKGSGSSGIASRLRKTALARRGGSKGSPPVISAPYRVLKEGQKDRPHNVRGRLFNSLRRSADAVVSSEGSARQKSPKMKNMFHGNWAGKLQSPRRTTKLANPGDSIKKLRSMVSRGLAHQIKPNQAQKFPEVYNKIKNMPRAEYEYLLPMATSDRKLFGRKGRGLDVGKSMLVRFYPDGSYGTHPMPKEAYPLGAQKLIPSSTVQVGGRGLGKGIDRLLQEVENLVAEKRVSDFRTRQAAASFIRQTGMGSRRAAAI